MTNDSDINTDLVGKYLSGEATPEEAIAIDRWRTKDPKTAKAFEEIASVWYKANDEQVYSAPDSHIAWKQLQEQLLTQKKTNVKRLLSPFRIAASVLLIVSAAMIVMLTINRNKTTSVNYTVLSTVQDTLNVTLPDSSIVMLKPNSSFHYKKSSFDTSREVFLTGDAAFDVRHVNNNPFIINNGEIGIKVVGTMFSIHNEKNKATVKVKRGIVLVYHNSDTLSVKAGNTAIYDKQTKQLAFENMNSSQQSTVVLIFNDAPMSEVKSELEKAYQVKIIFDNQLLNECHISTQFKNKPLKEVLDIIVSSLNIQYKVENDTIHFYGHACN